jgi:hypothetical protein
MKAVRAVCWKKKTSGTIFNPHAVDMDLKKVTIAMELGSISVFTLLN